MRSLGLSLFILAACGHKSPSIFPDSTGSGGGASSTESSGMNMQGDSWTSGSRLKVRYYTSNDGSKMPVGFRDLKRNENCSPRIASDGNVRCLPDRYAVTDGYFADKNCSQALGVVFAGCQPPYGFDIGIGCNAGAKVFQVSSTFNGSAIYVKSNGACDMLPVGSASFVELGSELPASTFAEMTEE